MEWDLIFTLGGWLIGLPAVGAIGKGFMDNYSQKNVNISHSRIEHEYFKKRLLFETKNDLYKKLYLIVKEVEGSLYSFNDEFIDNHFKGFQEEAVARYKKYSNEDVVNINRKIYYYNEYDEHRFKINYELSVQKIKDSIRALNNFMATHEYLFTKDENNKIKEIQNKCEEMKKYVEDVQHNIKSNDFNMEDEYIDFKKEFGEEYQLNCDELDRIIDELTVIIQKNLSM